MIQSGGLILWHDFNYCDINGVFDILKELYSTLPLHHIEGTNLVYYRHDFN